MGAPFRLPPRHSATDEIASNVEGIAQMAEESGASIYRTNEEAIRLAEVAAKLRQTVAGFQI